MDLNDKMVARKKKKFLALRHKLKYTIQICLYCIKLN